MVGGLGVAALKYAALEAGYVEVDRKTVHDLKYGPLIDRVAKQVSEDIMTKYIPEAKETEASIKRMGQLFKARAEQVLEVNNVLDREIEIVAPAVGSLERGEFEERQVAER